MHRSKICMIEPWVEIVPTFIFKIIPKCAKYIYHQNVISHDVIKKAPMSYVNKFKPYRCYTQKFARLYHINGYAEGGRSDEIQFLYGTTTANAINFNINCKNL